MKELAAIRFYLHHALWECEKHWSNKHNGITNFAALLREIERWRFEANERVCFVTFNYDTMLEKALQLVLNQTFLDFSHYVSQPHSILIKPHGSINWGLSVGVRYPKPSSLIKDVAGLTLRDSYHLVARHPMVLDNGEIGFPALSIPVENKDEFNCPQEHIEALAKCIPDVTKIMTIGWRATESRFLGMLRNRLTGLKDAPGLMVVSGSQEGASETRTNLGIGHLTAYRWIESGFTGLISSLDQLEDFLRLEIA